MPRACPHTITVGGYLLGILSAQERDEFHDHAEACTHCRRAIEELRPSARLLETLKTAVRQPGGRSPRSNAPVFGPFARLAVFYP